MRDALSLKQVDYDATSFKVILNYGPADGAMEIAKSESTEDIRAKINKISAYGDYDNYWRSAG